MILLPGNQVNIFIVLVKLIEAYLRVYPHGNYNQREDRNRHSDEIDQEGAQVAADATEPGNEDVAENIHLP